MKQKIRMKITRTRDIAKVIQLCMRFQSQYET